MRIDTAKNVAPRGLPTCRNRWVSAKVTSRFGCWVVKSADASAGDVDDDATWRLFGSLTPCSEVFRRKSCVTAMPMLAKEREVRSQARKVRSTAH